jgi:DNA-binding protein HU-beta
MTKSALLAALADKSGLSKKEVGGILEILTSMAYSEVKKNGDFMIPGLGKLVKVTEKLSRQITSYGVISIFGKNVVKLCC